MHHFDYKDGVLHAEKINLKELAEKIGTPFYCYSARTFARHYRVFADAFKDQNALVCYAMKANSNLAILRILAEQGAGMDVVSMGELLRAREVGVPGERILFSGVGKTRDEMALALDMGILCFNVESEPELHVLNEVAKSKGMVAPVSIRVNPDVDARTHEKISTGKKANKFGVAWEEARRIYTMIAEELPALKITGIDMHIGSQITELDPFDDAFSLLKELVRDLKRDGHQIDHIDLGGGLGIPYATEDNPPHPDDYAAMIKQRLGALDMKLIFEPGRLIAGNAGILVSEVLYVKNNDEKIFTIADVGMNDLIRPTLYEAYHEILPVDEALGKRELRKMDVVGPVCETGDYMAKGRFLPPFKPGDLLAIMTAGAYGASQANSYNTRPLIPEVLVDGDQYAIIRKRPTYEEILTLDVAPKWES